MSKQKHEIDLTTRRGDDTLGNFAFFTGIISIPLSVVVIGLPLGIIAYITGKKGIKFAETLPDSGRGGRAYLGKLFGTFGIVLSIIAVVIWILVFFFAAILAIIGAIGKAVSGS